MTAGFKMVYSIAVSWSLSWLSLRACTKTRNNETKRTKPPKKAKRNHRNETTETSETTGTRKIVSKYMKKLKKDDFDLCYGSLISHPDPRVWHRDITNSRWACKDGWAQVRRAWRHEGEEKVDIVYLLKERAFSIFYILKKTYVFNQSERVEGPIYIIIKKNSWKRKDPLNRLQFRLDWPFSLAHPRCKNLQHAPVTRTKNTKKLT